MPTTTYDISAKKDGDSRAIHLTVTSPTGRYERRVTRAKVDSPAKMAEWLLNQSTSPTGDEAMFRYRLAVTWHTEQIQDALSGQPATIKVVDTVDAREPVEEAAWAGVINSPLGTATLAEANSVVDGITDLAGAKAYLRQLNAVIIGLREINRRILETLRESGIR